MRLARSAKIPAPFVGSAHSNELGTDAPFTHWHNYYSTYGRRASRLRLLSIRLARSAAPLPPWQRPRAWVAVGARGRCQPRWQALALSGSPRLPGHGPSCGGRFKTKAGADPSETQDAPPLRWDVDPTWHRPADRPEVKL